MATGKQPISSVIMSVLAIISIAVFIPLVVGGSISLAIALAGEDHYKDTPDDHNGFALLAATRSGNCSGFPSTSQTLVVSEFSKNWTQMNTPSTTCILSGTTGLDSVKIQIPMSVLPDPSNYTFSKFYIEMVSRTAYATSFSNNATYNMTLQVNGTTVFDAKNIYTKQYILDSSSNQRYYLNGTVQLDAIDELRYRMAAGACYPNCTATVNLSGYTQNGGTYGKIPILSNNQYIRVTTSVTDVETGNLVLTVMPWLLATVNFLIALAATPYWNPVGGFLKKKARGI